MSDEAARPVPSTALAVVAHPDDVDFGMAGTLSRWVDHGCDVVYCIVTDGAAGGSDGELHHRMAQVREAEQRAAAAVVGASDVVFLGYPDGLLEVSLKLRFDITRVIREVRPDLVLTQYPERNFSRIYTSHPDHMAAGEATLRAVYPDARNPFTFKELAAEGLEAHTVGEVWLSGAPAPDVFVDVTDEFERKIKALRCHESQVGGRPEAEFRARLVEWGERTARAGGLGEHRIAEAYLRVDTR
ncbi:MAG: PIG-L family deacetylase [Acidimicrobiia bacterium]|nr:PIG-L family deacetylase [Acidimicrobiia bacterium]